MSEIVVKEDHNGGAVSANVGDTLLVELPENPTTGFRWAPGELDARIVALQGDDFVPGSSGAIGAGGTRAFRFQLKGAGSARLQLKLARAWQPGVSAKVFEIQIHVK